MPNKGTKFKIKAGRAGGNQVYCIKTQLITGNNVITVKGLKSISCQTDRLLKHNKRVGKKPRGKSSTKENSISSEVSQAITSKMNSHPGYFTEAGSKQQTEEPVFSEEEDEPHDIPFKEIPWPTSLWKMEAGWKPIFQAPQHASPLDPRAQTQIPIAERLASRLSNRKELRVFKPRTIPLLSLIHI